MTTISDARRDRPSAWATLRRGLALSPEFRVGLPLTLLLALVATVGRVVVPVAVQRTVDSGLLGAGGPDVGQVRGVVTAAAVATLLTAVAAYYLNVRLFRTSESGLASLRVRAFRHVHDLSVLTQNAERRGSLVSRVTSDVDTISTFMQWGGLLMVVSLGQLVVATVLMAFYSWQLTVLVWVCFLPLFLLMRTFQKRVSDAYGAVRERVGDLLGAVSESVVGASTVRAYAIEERTGRRIDRAIESHRSAATRAQGLVALTFSSGEIVAGVANAAVVIVGVLLGIDGDLTIGELLAFLFLVTLFVGPVQIGTEVLSEAQNAIAGWRRVLGVLDTPADVSDPGVEGRTLDRGPIDVLFEDVSFAYPGGPTVLADVNAALAPRSRVAVVGETGSGKTTFAKLLTRLMDPAQGRVLVDGVDLRDLSFSSLRARIVMVPQDGFLFEGSIADNIRFGRPDVTDAEIELSLTELGLLDWLDGLPHRLGTVVGQRGEQLSAGERQLVALVRAYVADPDLLVLDEATSAVDPGTEVRIARALEGLTRGRTALTIAHRLSTAESADDVIVFDKGRIVERGHHSELVSAGGIYSRLHASWSAQQRS
ncbi:MAG: ABC transporter ATP-binding protein/permease [Spirochaetaceae bacterium]|nr:ABC transporter ATP-binding protein/permease [Spirochaetaceae bacterium]